MWRAFVRAGKNMQPSEDHPGTSGPVPIRKFTGSPRKRQMHRNAHNLRHWTKRRPSVEEVLVEIVNAPMLRRGRSKAGQGKRGSEYMLAETCIRVLGIKRVDEQRKVRLDWLRWHVQVKQRRSRHFPGNPTLLDQPQERLSGSKHGQTL